MLILIACLLSQFQPEGNHPTVADFKEKSLAALKVQIAADRAEVEAQRPTKKQLAKLPRTKTQAATKAINERLAQLNALEKTESPPPLKIVIQNAVVGDIGLLFRREVFDAKVLAGNTAVNTQQVEINPAQLTVLNFLDKSTLYCSCGNSRFVLRNYKGKIGQIGSTIAPEGIYFVSGTYELLGENLLAFEAWKHQAEWEQSSTKPAEKPVDDGNQSKAAKKRPVTKK